VRTFVAEVVVMTHAGSLHRPRHAGSTTRSAVRGVAQWLAPGGPRATRTCRAQ
jgi:hypothetical protein